MCVCLQYYCGFSCACALVVAFALDPTYQIRRQSRWPCTPCHWLPSFDAKQKSSFSTSKPRLLEFKGFGGMEGMPCSLRPFARSLDDSRRSCYLAVGDQGIFLFFWSPFQQCSIQNTRYLLRVFPAHRWSNVSQVYKTYLRSPGGDP